MDINKYGIILNINSFRNEVFDLVEGNEFIIASDLQNPIDVYRSYYCKCFNVEFSRAEKNKLRNTNEMIIKSFNVTRKVLSNQHISDDFVISYQSSHCRLYFPINLPIISHEQRLFRVGKLQERLTALQVPYSDYYKELRESEMFQCLWGNILRYCTTNLIKALHFIDLHIFVDEYFMKAFKNMNQERESYFQLTIQKIKSNNQIGSINWIEQSSQFNLTAGEATDGLIEKLKSGMKDKVDVELFFDLKSKSATSLTSVQITLLEGHFLNKTFSERAIICEYHEKSKKAKNKKATSLKLVLHIYKKDDTNYIDNVHNVGNYLKGTNLETDVNFIKLGIMYFKKNFKSFSSLKKEIEKGNDQEVNSKILLSHIIKGGQLFETVEYLDDLVNIESTSGTIMYGKFENGFEHLIPHYTNYEDHIEIGVFSSPIIIYRLQIQDLLNMHINISNDVNKQNMEKEIKATIQMLLYS